MDDATACLSRSFERYLRQEPRPRTIGNYVDVLRRMAEKLGTVPTREVT